MGCIYRQTKSPFWWIKWIGVDGRAQYESSRSTDHQVAKELLATYEAKIAHGEPVTSAGRRLKFKDAAASLIEDYTLRGCVTLPELKSSLQAAPDTLLRSLQAGRDRRRDAPAIQGQAVSRSPRRQEGADQNLQAQRSARRDACRPQGLRSGDAQPRAGIYRTDVRSGREGQQALSMRPSSSTSARRTTSARALPSPARSSTSSPSCRSPISPWSASPI